MNDEWKTLSSASKRVRYAARAGHVHFVARLAGLENSSCPAGDRPRLRHLIAPQDAAFGWYITAGYQRAPARRDPVAEPRLSDDVNVVVVIC